MEREMSAPVLIKRSDLNRMADIAIARGVTVWIEINGKKIGVSPEPHTAEASRKVAKVDEINL